jgi:uroporphyrinogen-III synthase
MAAALYFGKKESGPPFEYVIFASAGGVREFLERNRLPEKARAICIGSLTAAEYARLTGREAVIAGECSVEGIRRALHGL